MNMILKSHLAMSGEVTVIFILTRCK